MANAVKSAPLKNSSLWAKEEEYVKDGQIVKEYDPAKKYVFRLTSISQDLLHPVIDMRTKRVAPKKNFKPFQNLVFTSQIVWKDQRTNIRYYDGCTSIFVSEQPSEKELVDQLNRQTQRRNFIDGHLVIEGYDKLLLLYMDICSWNTESPFRTSTATGIFVPMNPDKAAKEQTAKIDLIEEALKLAKEADVNKMEYHSSYLGISKVDYVSGNPLNPSEIRANYRKYAMENPSKFIETYGNKSIEVKYYIDKALLDGIISNRFNPNKATWGTSNNEICDISGLKSSEAISEKLFEFSQTEDGSDFLIQLKSIFNN